MKNGTWDLTAIYPSFESCEFQQDYFALSQKIEAFNLWTAQNLLQTDNTVYKLEYYIRLQNELGTLSSKLLEFAQLQLSVNTNNNLAVKYLDKLEEYLTELTASQVIFQKWLSSIENIEPFIASSPILKEHSYYLKQVFTMGQYLLTEQEEVILSKMKPTGSLSWAKLHDSLTSTVTVSIEEKELPLSEVRNMAYSSDASCRKNAYKAELASYSKISTASAACLNAIKGEVLTECNLRGYTSPLEMTLLHSRMDSITLNAMLEVMEESLPVFQKYLSKKAEFLGYKNGLPFYDLFAPIGTCQLHYTYEEAQKFITEHFYSFSKTLGDYAVHAFENNWIDVYPQNAKQGGAFCSNIHSIGESRILTNFTGSFSDCITIAHELGHGYHGYCLKNQSFLNSDYPMPIAETASTFCETIVKNAALKNASSTEAITILENDIADNTQIIVDILSRFYFEDIVFQKRKEGSLSVEELCSIMQDCQKRTYGTGLSSNYLHPYMWICKTHYYDADYNYYNFPYAFGLLLAKGLYSKYLQTNTAFIPEYDALLSASGSASLSEVAAMAHIDIQSKEFWHSSLELITTDIEKFLTLLDTL